MPNRLKELREKENLTQEELADAIGTTKQTVGRWENSKRRLKEPWVSKIATALQVHPGALYQEMPSTQLNERETRLVKVFRQLEEPRQRAFIQAIDALGKSLGDLDATNEDHKN